MNNITENIDSELDIILAKHNGELGVTWEDPDVVTPDTKQAITSLIKELVAEARIDELTLLADFQMGDITVMGRNERSWRDRISELEQNLLKALEEV